MPYSQLTPDMKQAIDNIHQAIMRHKHTMLNLQSMGPRLLLPQTQDGAPADSQTKTTLLQERLHKLQSQLNRLQQDLQQLDATATAQEKASEKAVVDTIMYAQWPLEALAVRKGVRLSPSHSSSSGTGEEKKSEQGDDHGTSPSSTAVTTTTAAKIRDALNQGLASVDRIDRMPSPYYWETLIGLEQRALQLWEQTMTVQQQLQQSRALTQLSQNTSTTAVISEIVETQHVALSRLEQQMQQLHDTVERVRFRYRRYERGENVLDRAAVQERERQRRIDEQIQMQFLQAAAAPGATGGGTPGGAPAPATGFGFGGAPAPTGANLFGSTPAPAGTGFFAAPAAGGFASFGSTTTRTPSNKKKSGSKSGGRLGK